MVEGLAVAGRQITATSRVYRRKETVPNGPGTVSENLQILPTGYQVLYRDLAPPPLGKRLP